MVGGHDDALVKKTLALRTGVGVGSAMERSSALDELLALLSRGLHRRYAGESVTQWEHALQTAALAVQAQASSALVAAALFHDLGHLVDAEVDATPTLAGHDDRHELVAARRLAPVFGPAVSEPVRLHVEAKRYLVATTPGYFGRLSADSVRSLALQGGPMDAAECAAFRLQPHATDALALRCWDELAKDGGAPPQRLERFLPALHTALQSAGQGGVAPADHGAP